MKGFSTLLICLCIFLVFSSLIMLTNSESENFKDYNYFVEGNRGGDNGDPLPLPPNPPPPPPPGFT